VARVVLFAGAALWMLAGGAGVSLAIVGAEAVHSALPPLAISVDALSGTLVALGVAGLAVGLAHAVIGAGLGRGRPWAASAGLLLSAVSLAGFAAMATAALTAGAAGSMAGAVALAGALGSLVLAVLYGLTAAALTRHLRAGGRF
jgi:hypothetical protein